MAYDVELVQRLREQMSELVGLEQKKMFGGVGFMLHGNMACGVKDTDLIVRVGTEQYERAMAEPHTKPLNLTGRVMRGWVMVEAQGYESEEGLRSWVERGVQCALSLPPK
ncbi:MAG: TfoX/Sxy family protein [Chloroflexota bacterium]